MMNGVYIGIFSYLIVSKAQMHLGLEHVVFVMSKSDSKRKNVDANHLSLSRKGLQARKSNNQITHPSIKICFDTQGKIER